MIFWDTSAVVPLVVREPGTVACAALLHHDPELLVWWGTSVECASAIARREREHGFTRLEADQARAVLAALGVAWSEVEPTSEVRGHAERLLRRHPLRAADALQLGAALVWAEGRPRGHRFATFDQRLAEAARGEGFALAL